MKAALTVCLVFALSVIYFMQGLDQHGIEYRDDEIFYYNSTKEMVATGNVLSPKYFGEDRFQKPILFYWLILLSYKIFGVGWMGARFVAVVAAALTVGLTWKMAREFFNESTAWVSAAVLMTVPLFFRHAKNAVPDMALNFFIVLAIYSAYKFLDDPQRKGYGWLFFITCGLGFMIKGPTAIVIPVLVTVIYALWVRRPWGLVAMNFPFGALILAVIILPWFIYMFAVHGQSYLQYMLGTEIGDRVVSSGGTNFFSSLMTTLRHNVVFYFETILSYFAPWSGFAVLAIPFGLWAARDKSEYRDGLILLNIWFWVVFVFFSLLHGRINHYMLVLTTPFAVLVGLFLVKDFASAAWLARATVFFRKGLMVLIIALGCLALVMLRVFFLQGPRLEALYFAAGFVVCFLIIRKMREPLVPTLVLAGFLLFVYAQSGLIFKARLVPHAALQEIAEIINRDGNTASVIGVGSHDIHEKEFQVYFDRQVIKAATSDPNQTRHRLDELFLKRGAVYCLLTKEDYGTLIRQRIKDNLDVIHEDLMFRRRIRVDRDFFRALLRLDRPAVRDYFMEKVVLVRKQ